MNLLNELMMITEMRQSQNLKLTSIANELIRELSNINDNSQLKLDAGDDETPDFLKKSQLARVFKREHQDLIGAAKEVSKHKASSALKQITKLPTTAFKSDSKNTSIKNGKTMMDSLYLLKDGLKDIGELELHHLLSGELDRFEDLQSRTAKKSKNSASTAGLDKRNTELRNIQGQQQTQVEDLVNSVIKSLPKHMQHEARGVVSKSANKLADLESYINNY